MFLVNHFDRLEYDIHLLIDVDVIHQVEVKEQILDFTFNSNCKTSIIF